MVCIVCILQRPGPGGLETDFVIFLKKKKTILILLCFIELKHAERSASNGCECIHEAYDCGCCEHMEIDRIGLNDTGNRSTVPQSIFGCIH